MGRVAFAQEQFNRMVRDSERQHLSPDTCWNLVDYIPGLDAPLTKRGGWSYASNDISAVKATASYVTAGRYAPFAAASKNCAIDEDGEFYTIAANGTVTDVGLSNASTPIGGLAFHRNKLLIPRGDGTTAPGYYDGSTLGTLAGSPPTGKYTGVYKDRAILASTSAQPNYVYFSGAGDPTSWDTTNSFIACSFPVTGIATLRNAVIMFSQERAERIRGATPPPNTDMVKEPLFEPGCIDARSICVLGDDVVFANTTGFYITDGDQVKDVTAAGGMTRYWRDMLASFVAGTWTIAVGKHRRRFIISVMNGSTFVDAFLVDRDSYSWLRLSNMKALAFWDSVGITAETYAASRAAPRLLGMASMWSPAAGVKNDADTTAVTPVYESPFLTGKTFGLKAFRDVYITYDLRDAATDNPVLTAAYITEPEATSYTTTVNLSDSALTLPETTRTTTLPRHIHKDAEGVAFKITQTNASSATRIHKLGLDATELEGTTLRQAA